MCLNTFHAFHCNELYSAEEDIKKNRQGIIRGIQYEPKRGMQRSVMYRIHVKDAQPQTMACNISQIEVVPYRAVLECPSNDIILLYHAVRYLADNRGTILDQ